jgi:hypothetical protein
VFGSVVAGAFQITFRAEIHANDFFYFLKIIFDISTSKRSKKYKPHSILAKKKNSNFHKTQVETHYQTLPSSTRKSCFLNKNTKKYNFSIVTLQKSREFTIISF